MLESRHQHLPPGTGTLGMSLFLAALVMLFAASLVGYIIIRIRGDSTDPLGHLDIPRGLWVSTALILASSFTVHRAVQNVRQERQTSFRNGLTITMLLAVGFLLVQTPSLMALLAQHRVLRDEHIYFYGLVFFLVLVHGLHVIGGLLPLANITVKAHRGHYDHEHHGPVKYIAMYWHFLDGVWVTMFAVLIVTA